MRRLFAVIALLTLASIAVAQEARPAIFIPPTGDGFDVYMATAMAKKGVPATVVMSAESAQMTLKTALMPEHKRLKFGGCVMGACGGSKIPSASVQLLDRDGAVVWSFAMETDDESTKKEVAEEIAKHLKRDYFRQ